MLAAWYGLEDNVKLLLEFGADPDLRVGEQRALELATVRGRGKVAALLAKR